jgi:uncharacterized membrane protein (DUF2068 family)
MHLLMNIDDCFLTTSANILTIKYNASQHKLLYMHVVYVLIFNKPFLANFASSKKCLHLFKCMCLCQYGIEMCMAYGTWHMAHGISLNANKHCCFSFDFSAIQTVVLFLPHSVYYILKASHFLEASRFSLYLLKYSFMYLRSKCQY